MSASSLGDDLLANVEEETLDELLRSLREAETPYRPNAGFAALDNILSVFQSPFSARPEETPLSAVLKERPPAIIEITGAAAASSGKTQLLYRLIASTLMPAKFEELPPKGKCQAVVLLDLSGRFSILRLRTVMKALISALSSYSDDEISALTLESLMHLHVFRPQSTPSLLASLASLPDYLLAQPPTHHSSNRSLGLLAINDLSSFLWQDRLDAEDAIDPATTSAGAGGDPLLLQRYRKLVSHLRHLHDVFSCTVVATNWGLSIPSTVMGQPALRPHLPAVWNNFCTVKIVVERDRVSKFGPGMSIEEANLEDNQRWEAVEQSGFSAWVNWSGCEGWREEVRETVKNLDNSGRFTFKASDGGVFIDESNTE